MQFPKFLLCLWYVVVEVDSILHQKATFLRFSFLSDLPNEVLWKETSPGIIPTLQSGVIIGMVSTRVVLCVTVYSSDICIPILHIYSTFMGGRPYMLWQYLPSRTIRAALHVWLSAQLLGNGSCREPPRAGVLQYCYTWLRPSVCTQA